MNRKISKKAQVGETITWIVATIVIVVVLIFFMFGASMLGSTKNIGEVKESLFSKSESFGEDIFLKKSIYTYLSLNTDTLKKKLEVYLTEDGEEAFLENLKEIRKGYNKR